MTETISPLKTTDDNANADASAVHLEVSANNEDGQDDSEEMKPSSCTSTSCCTIS